MEEDRLIHMQAVHSQFEDGLQRLVNIDDFITNDWHNIVVGEDHS